MTFSHVTTAAVKNRRLHIVDFDDNKINLCEGMALDEVVTDAITDEKTVVVKLIHYLADG